MPTLSKMLAPFRKLEKPEQLATVIDSAEAVRVLGSWPSTVKKWTKSKGRAPRSSARLWEWLWAGVEYDRSGLGSRARLSNARAHSMLSVLMSARLVYPDGTIAKPAQEFVDAYIARKLKPKTPAKAPKEKRHLEGPRARPCPHCSAVPGERCKMKNGKHYTKPFHHLARRSENDG